MNSQDKSDDELCADNLSNYSCDSDTEKLIDDEENDSSESEDLTKRTNIVISSDSDSESSPDEDIDWNTVEDRSMSMPFLGCAGLNPECEVESVTDAIDLFIGDEIMGFMAEESNRYHAQNIQHFREGTKSLKWKDITMDEMKKFLGLITLMAQTCKERSEYWSTDPLLRMPIFPGTMSRTRFLQIWKSWHFSHNEMIADNSDKLCKVRPVVDYLLPKFLNVYKPRQKLSLEESIIPWKGKLSSRVSNAVKVVKPGILMRVVCEAATGYICNFEMFAKRSKKVLKSVETILYPYFGLWHHVYMDTYYAHNPPSDKKIEIHGTALQNDTHEHMKLKLDHNTRAKTVDRADQYPFYNSTLLKTSKWTKRVVMYLLNCALFNAYTVYKSRHGNTIGYKKFLLETARHWITVDCAVKETNEEELEPVWRPRKADPPGRLSMDMKVHKVQRILGKGKKFNAQRKCRVCAARGKRSQTVFMCQSCGVALHRGTCFERYHTMKVY